MAPRGQRPKLVVIVGPTASGKSDLALQVAQDFNGEIISADSLTVYKYMNIGTAKPTKSDQSRVAHWGLDLIGPGQRFTAADFKRYAEDKIADIQGRGRLPVVVGGTGLYIDALILNFSFGSKVDSKLRQKLEKLTTQSLQKLINKRAYLMPENSQNRRHLIRTIERQGRIGTKAKTLPEHIIFVGLMPASEELKKKINHRVEKMFGAGLAKETEQLLEKYGRESLLSKAKVAYGPVVEYLSGNIAMAQAKEKLKTAHWHYARRQKTWFKRNKFIHWFDSAKPAYDYIKEQLNT